MRWGWTFRSKHPLGDSATQMNSVFLEWKQADPFPAAIVACFQRSACDFVKKTFAVFFAKSHGVATISR